MTGNEDVVDEVSLTDDELARIVAALGVPVESEGLRPTARQVGIAPSALRNLLDGSRPYRVTIRKLERWYVEHGTHWAAVEGATAQFALEMLLRAIPGAEATRTRLELCETLKAAYMRQEQLPPAWLREVRPRAANDA